MVVAVNLSADQPTWVWVVLVVLVLYVVGKVKDRSRPRPHHAPSRPRHGFEAVAGCDEAVEDLREIVAFARDPERFARLGARPPTGALLTGPPGTGKTLLARAVAAEAGIPFIDASATDFVEMYVGVGAKRVRELYADARSKGRAIVFIDEIDAVARARSMNGHETGTPGGPIEHENTLMALLTELDGFKESSVITIAATNRPDVLDPALLRPGRLERRIDVPLPDRKGRAAIVSVHLSNKPHTDDVDVDAIAARTAGFSGADLARVCNEAALAAVRLNLPAIDAECCTSAVELVALGRPRTSMVVSDEDRTITAWHEAGHAVCGAMLPDAPDPVSVSVVPRGPAAGVTWFQSTDRLFVSKQAAYAQLVVALGGRAAEEVLLGGSCTHGAAGDLSTATALATQMVSVYGFGSSLSSRSPSPFSGYDAHTTNEVDALLAAAHADATEIVQTHTPAVEALVDALVENLTVSGEQVREIIAASSHPSPVASPRPSHAHPPIAALRNVVAPSSDRTNNHRRPSSHRSRTTTPRSTKRPSLHQRALAAVRSVVNRLPA